MKLLSNGIECRAIRGAEHTNPGKQGTLLRLQKLDKPITSLGSNEISPLSIQYSLNSPGATSRITDLDTFSPSTIASPGANTSLRDSMLAPKLPELHSHFQAREAKYTRRTENLSAACLGLHQRLEAINPLKHLSPKRLVSKPQIIEDFKISEGTVGQLENTISISIAHHFTHNSCMKIKVNPRPITGAIEESVMKRVMEAKDLKILIDNKPLKSINSKPVKQEVTSSKKILPSTIANTRSVTYEDLYNEINNNHSNLQAYWVKESGHLYMMVTKKEGQISPEHFSIKQSTGAGPKIDMCHELAIIESASKKAIGQNRAAVHVSVGGTAAKRYSAKDAEGNFLFDIQSKGGLEFKLPPPQVTQLGGYDLYHSVKGDVTKIKIGFNSHSAKLDVLTTIDLVNDITQLNTLYSKYTQQHSDNLVSQSQQRQLLEYGFMYNNKGQLNLQDSKVLETALDKNILGVLDFFKQLHNTAQNYSQKLIEDTASYIEELASEKEKIAYEISAMFSEPLSPAMLQPITQSSQTDLSFGSPKPQLQEYFAQSDLGLSLHEPKLMREHSSQTIFESLQQKREMSTQAAPPLAREFSTQTENPPETAKWKSDASSQTMTDVSLDSMTLSAKVDQAKLDKHSAELDAIRNRLKRVENLFPKHEQKQEFGRYQNNGYASFDPYYQERMFERVVESGVNKALSAKLESKYRYLKGAYEELRQKPTNTYYDSTPPSDSTRYSSTPTRATPVPENVMNNVDFTTSRTANMQGEKVTRHVLTEKSADNAARYMLRSDAVAMQANPRAEERLKFSRSAPPKSKSEATYTILNRQGTNSTSKEVRLKDYGNVNNDGDIVTYTSLHSTLGQSTQGNKVNLAKSQKLPSPGYYMPTAHGHNIQSYAQNSRIMEQSLNRSSFSKIDLMQSKVTSLQQKLGEMRSYNPVIRYKA